MIVVETDDFAVYHAIVSELKSRDATFTTVAPGDPRPEHGAVVITDADHEIDDIDQPVIRTTPDRVRAAVAEAFDVLLDRSDARHIIGVDPGARPGIAVLQEGIIVAAYHVPFSDAVDQIRAAIAESTDPLVRIGDGSRLHGAAIINELQDVSIELVDERGTTPALGPGARGMGDVLAAINIARQSGEPIESREIEPTDGEIVTIQRRSRHRSADNRAIDTALARRVARGELSIDEALDIHRNQS